MKNYLAKLTKWLGYSIAFFIVLAATIVSVGRLLTPYLNEHLPDFEVWARELLDTPVKIEKVYISWNLYIPQLTMDHVVIVDKHTKKQTFEINQIKINLKILESLLERKPIPSYINISGVNVTIREGKTGKVMIAGWGPFSVSDNLTGAAEEGGIVAQWIFSQPALVLDDINIKFIPIPGEGEMKSFTLYKLSLHNIKHSHALSGRAILNQEISSSIAFKLEWKGDLQDPAKITAHFYAYLEAVSLPQWLKNKTWKNLRILEGLGSAKLWIDWNQGQFQKIQTQFQIYELKLQSLLTKKTQLITRLNGHVGWKRDGDKQIFAGNDILIDLPEHLWPITRFYVVLPQLSGEYLARADYIDLADSYEFMTGCGLLPDKLENILFDLKPKGEIRALNVKLNNLDQLENNSLSMKFHALSINAYHQYPAIKNLTGSIQWDKNTGNLAVHSNQSAFLLNSMFTKPITFDQLHGDFKLQKKSNGEWLLNAKDIHAENNNLKVQSNLTLTIPVAESPLIDLTTDIIITNAAHLAEYMPAKLLDPDLDKWLKQAFLQGQFTAKAIVQGRMSDFPFVNGNGQFLVNIESKDLHFSYAPDWPTIKHLNGNITFSGEKMTVRVANGQLLNIPIFNIFAEIPYIGPKQPQILTVKGVINGEMSEGLQFIHHSPLEKTIGRDFNHLDIKGPMQLNLVLTVPVKKPELTQVMSDINFLNANLEMPGWNIALDHLKGELHFTENTIQAKAIQGDLFGEPVVLQVTTEKPAKRPSFVKVVLESKITSALLQSWLTKSPLAPFIKGGAAYTAELQLPSVEQRQPSQLIIRSNLKGITLELPDGLGKKSDEALDTTFLANIDENQPLQVKLKLGKKLTAAATLKQTNGGMDIYSGELRMGSNGEADWQTLPGMLISGQFDTLNWDVLKKYSPESKPNANEPAMFNLLRGLDIHAKKIIGLAQTLTQARIQVVKSPTNWTVNINAAEMVGQIILPINLSARQTIQANFQYIYLAPTAKTTETLNPKQLPGITFAGNVVRYKGKDLGRIEFDLVPVPNGLRLESLSADYSLYNLQAVGDWLSIDNNKSQTNLKGTLTTKNVANFLNYWGSSSPNPVGSKGSMKFDLSWPDAPYNPTLTKMSGDASLDITSGHIINLDQSTNAKMGFGRMLNILSLQSLSRVLTLNFSDLTAEGYSFDFMKGNFSLKNGSIYTDDTRMNGSLANIEMKGRIGLSTKDYNLTLNITPLMTGSIPVVAAIAVNPLIGVAAWAVEKVASSAVSSAATKRYLITGTWDKPIWRESK